jgi:hypothetical protein
VQPAPSDTVFSDGGTLGGGVTRDCRRGEIKRTAEPRPQITQSKLRTGNKEISSCETGIAVIGTPSYF